MKIIRIEVLRKRCIS